MADSSPHPLPGAVPTDPVGARLRALAAALGRQAARAAFRAAGAEGEANSGRDPKEPDHAETHTR